MCLVFRFLLLLGYLFAFTVISQAAVGDLTPGDPISWDGFTLYPLLAEDESLPFSTVAGDRALGAGSAFLTEVGVLPPSSTPHSQDKTSDEALLATMNILQSYNYTRFYLLFICGELSVGGMQDRVISQDILIPPGASQMDTPTFCVELDRWFSNSQKPELNGVLIDPQMRLQVLINPLQSYIWELINNLLKENKIISLTRSYNALYSSILEDQAIWKQVEAIQDVPRNLKVRGVLIANGDHFWTLDIFCSHDLLVTYWPKLLLSYQLGARHLLKRDGNFGREDAQATLGTLTSATSRKIALEYYPPDCDYLKLISGEKYVGVNFTYKGYPIHTTFFNREP